VLIDKGYDNQLPELTVYHIEVIV